MRQQTAQKILEQTKNNYDALHIAWDRTRQFNDDFADFLQYVKPNSKLLDVGCGNARLLKTVQQVNVHYTGVDNSQGMLLMAQKNFPDQTFLLGDVLALPCADNTFDVVVCLATLHHIPSNALRRQAMQELVRVLKPGGIVIVRNWHYRSPGFLRRIFLNGCRKLLGGSDLDFGDAFVPWKGTAVKRYVHFFTRRSLRRLAKAAGVKSIKSYISSPTTRGFYNLVFIGQK